MVDAGETAESLVIALGIETEHYNLLALVLRSFHAVVFVLVQVHPTYLICYKRLTCLILNHTNIIHKLNTSLKHQYNISIHSIIKRQ